MYLSDPPAPEPDVEFAVVVLPGVEVEEEEDELLEDIFTDEVSEGFFFLCSLMVLMVS